jgi:hypothetical protein
MLGRMRQQRQDETSNPRLDLKVAGWDTVDVNTWQPLFHCEAWAWMVITEAARVVRPPQPARPR